MIKTLLASMSAFAYLGGFSGTAFAENDDLVMRKLGPALEYIYNQSSSAVAQKGAARMGKYGVAGGKEITVATVSEDRYVRIDAIASGSTEDLAVSMSAMGARDVSSYGRVVSAEFPVARLGDLGASAMLAFARPVMAVTNAGLVTSQGDRSMRTDKVRTKFRFDGTGVTVGVLSDSFACDPGPFNPNSPYTTPAEDVANGEIPADVNILSDFISPTCGDEGRAIAQIIHDIAPDAKIAFHSAFNGEADFAEGIVELAAAGADVIIDDVLYLGEPMFQDGIVAQAADEVARLGVPYYSSNGNFGRNAYQSDYRAVETGDGKFHDFDPGPNIDTKNNLVLSAFQTVIVMNWDNPSFSVSGPPGAQTDVDFIVFDAEGNRIPDCFEFLNENGVFPDLCQFQFFGDAGDGGNGGDAVEVASLVDFVGGAEVSFGLETQSGPPPGLVKFVVINGSLNGAEYPLGEVSGYGHNNAAGAEGVGAAAFYFTQEFEGDTNTLDVRAQAGEPWCDPACLSPISSAGGTPILFDIAGNRLATPEIRLKPGLVGPDGVNTTFFGFDTSRDDDDSDGVFETGEEGEFPNFFGTSAAAPHIASVAALMVDAENTQIIRTSRKGKVFYRMCEPRFGNKRRFGRTRRVKLMDVESRIDDGWLLGPCRRTEPKDIYHTMRSTAEDMTIRVNDTTGETSMTFDKSAPNGFDFDSGFGFIDAKAALKKFTSRKIFPLHDDDDEDSDPSRTEQQD